MKLWRKILTIIILAMLTTGCETARLEAETGLVEANEGLVEAETNREMADEAADDRQDWVDVAKRLQEEIASGRRASQEVIDELLDIIREREKAPGISPWAILILVLILAFVGIRVARWIIDNARETREHRERMAMLMLQSQAAAQRLMEPRPYYKIEPGVVIQSARVEK